VSCAGLVPTWPWLWFSAGWQSQDRALEVQLALRLLRLLG
jgi:hypothetical protein